MRCKIKFPHRDKPVEREVHEWYGQHYIKHGTDNIPVIQHAGEWMIAPEWEWLYEKKRTARTAGR